MTTAIKQFLAGTIDSKEQKSGFKAGSKKRMGKSLAILAIMPAVFIDVADGLLSRLNLARVRDAGAVG